MIAKFGIQFMPHSVPSRVGWPSKIGLCHIRNVRRMKLILPEERGLKVRFIKGGIMYATQVLRPGKPAVPAQKKPHAAAPARFGQKIARAPQNPAPRELHLMLGSLTAVEQQNRAQALKTARAAG